MMIKRPTKLDRKAIYLVSLIVLLGGGNLLWTSHVESTGQAQVKQATQTSIRASQEQINQATRAAIDANNQQWCDSLVLLTSGPVPTSKQPVGLKLYDDFHTLEHHFGCDHG